jgi:hypothetical protein
MGPASASVPALSTQSVVVADDVNLRAPRVLVAPWSPLWRAGGIIQERHPADALVQPLGDVVPHPVLEPEAVRTGRSSKEFDGVAKYEGRNGGLSIRTSA